MVEPSDFEAQPIDTDSIRSDSDLYQRLIIRHLDRIALQLSTALIKDDKLQDVGIRGMEFSIRLLESFLTPYIDEDYRERKKEIIKRIARNRTVLHDEESKIDYLNALSDWLDLQIEQFGRAGILPTQGEQLDMPEPTEDAPEADGEIYEQDDEQTENI